MKKQLVILTAVLLFVTATFSANVFATDTTTYSDVATIIEAEEGYSIKTEDGKTKATAGIHYTIENGSLIFQDYYGRGAAAIALPRQIGADANGPLYMNYIAQGAFVGTGLKAVYLPDCIMMSSKELLSTNPDTEEGIYFDTDTDVYTYSGTASAMTNIKNLRTDEDDTPVTTIDPTEETKTPTTGQSGDFKYTDYGTYVEITGYVGTSLSVTVPTSIAGLPVKSIKGTVFSTKKYDLVQIPASVSVSGQINAKKTVLNYDTDEPIVTEEKTYETDEEGHTYTIEDVIVIDETDLTEIEDASESGELTEEAESDASQSGEVETDESADEGEDDVDSDDQEKSNLWVWILVGVGGAAIIAGAALFAKKATDAEERRNSRKH